MSEISKPLHGSGGVILRVDLTSATISREVLDSKVARDYIGGRGLGDLLFTEGSKSALRSTGG